MCGSGVPVGCKSGHKKPLMCGLGMAVGCKSEGFRAGKRQKKLLMWLDGCKIGLTVESEEGEVPHLRWSQAPPLPWPRPGSADYYDNYINYGISHWNAYLIGLPWFIHPISDTPTLWMSLAAWQLNNDCNQQLLKSPRHERIMVQSGELSATVPLPSTLAGSACNAAGKISEVAVFLFVQTLLQQERKSWRKDCEVRFWIQGCVGLRVWQRKHVSICTHQEHHGLRFWFSISTVPGWLFFCTVLRKTRLYPRRYQLDHLNLPQLDTVVSCSVSISKSIPIPEIPRNIRKLSTLHIYKS